ncbi:MAG TPA: amidohydrolase family protein [Acidimicrobiales bacterium]|nr:amidohydrolase family protein [Acidimicrobiales bacterium]
MLLPDPEPREIFDLLISVDDHVIEPPGMFEGRLPAALADRAPRLIDHEGAPAWQLEDRILPNFGLNAVAGKPAEEWTDEPQDWDDMRRGCWDIDARIQDMDINGVYASVCFPSRVAGFGGVRFSEMKDQDLGLACMRAWNDWHLEEWAGPYPERIIPLQVPWLNDPALAADEIRRNAERGFKAVTFPDNPAALGKPPIWTDHWDPFLRACEETETVVSCHIGASGSGSGGFDVTSLDQARMGAIATATTLVTGVMAAVTWLYGGVFTKFPAITVTLAESGAGWVPALLDRLDYMEHHAGHAFTRAWTDELSQTEVLLRNLKFCIFDDVSAIDLRHRIGVDNLLLEVDYPHGDGTWPDSQPFARKLLGDLPDAEVDRIMYQNAAKLFRHPLPDGYAVD